MGRKGQLGQFTDPGCRVGKRGAVMLSGVVRISADGFYGYGDGIGGTGAFAGSAAAAL